MSFNIFSIAKPTAFAVLATVFASACAPNIPKRSEIECLGSGQEGAIRVKSWGYAKTTNKAIERAKKNAVVETLFNGVGGSCPSRPIVTSDERAAHKEYFDKFFAKGGPYLRFVQLSGDGTIDPKDRMKVGRRTKIGIKVLVRHRSLREQLERDINLKKTSNPF